MTSIIVNPNWKNRLGSISINPYPPQNKHDKSLCIPTTNGGRAGRVIRPLHLCHPSLLLLADNEPISIGSWSRVTRSVCLLELRLEKDLEIDRFWTWKAWERFFPLSVYGIVWTSILAFYIVEDYSSLHLYILLLMLSLVNIVSCDCLVFLCLCPLHTKKSSNRLLGSYLHDDCQFTIPCWFCLQYL